MVRTGATFADAAAGYLRYIGEDRVRKASTVEDYRAIIRVHLLPAFGDAALESITVSAVEAFQPRLAKPRPQRPADHAAHSQQDPQRAPRRIPPTAAPGHRVSVPASVRGDSAVPRRALTAIADHFRALQRLRVERATCRIRARGAS